MIRNRSIDSAAFLREAECIGATAKGLVTMLGFSGRVTAVLSDVAYLAGRDGEILWLFREGVPLHGRGILLSFPLRYLRPGQAFWMEGQNLTIGRVLAVDLGRAAEWTPASPRQGEAGVPVRVNGAVRRLLGTLAPVIGGDGPGRVLLGLSSILRGGDEEPFTREAWQMPILSPVFGLMKQCLTRGLSEIEIRGRELVGLGPGLTPCGDDFLGGIFFTAHWLRKAYPGTLGADAQPMIDLVRWAKNRTHPVSHAILGDLAVGQGPEPLHDLLRLLLDGEGRDGRTMEAVDCLVKAGHTTGWWILAGVLTRLLSVNE